MSSTSGNWLRKRLDSCSEELTKSFTEAKARVQRGLEQLNLKSAETFKRIPSIRDSFRSGKKESKKTKSPKKVKSSKKKSQPSSPQLSSDRSRIFTPNNSECSEYNATYRISRKSVDRSVVEQSCSSSESGHERTVRAVERTPLSTSTPKRPFNSSHSFPRVSRSRKIENINIVFASPFPSPAESNPSSVLHKDAFDMDNLRNVVAQIRAREDSVNPVRKPPRISRCRKVTRRLVNSPSSSLERHTSAEEESCSDPELAVSTDISLAYYDSGDDEPRSSPPLPIARADSEVDDDVYWIPKQVVNLPRTSSTLSMQSRSSYGDGGGSPGLSPIMNRDKRRLAEKENLRMKRAWGMTYRKDMTFAKKLFNINETQVVDSGYSDRSGANSRATSRATSSRATMYELQSRWRETPSPTTTASPSPTPPVAVPRKNKNQIAYTGFTDGPYELKSVYV